VITPVCNYSWVSVIGQKVAFWGRDYGYSIKRVEVTRQLTVCCSSKNQHHLFPRHQANKTLAKCQAVHSIRNFSKAAMDFFGTNHVSWTAHRWMQNLWHPAWGEIASVTLLGPLPMTSSRTSLAWNSSKLMGPWMKSSIKSKSFLKVHCPFGSRAQLWLQNSSSTALHPHPALIPWLLTWRVSF